MADAQSFIVDTDCGIDDAIALMILLASPEARLLGVTTVSGNVGVEQVTENVRRWGRVGAYAERLRRIGSLEVTRSAFGEDSGWTP